MCVWGGDGGDGVYMAPWLGRCAAGSVRRGLSVGVERGGLLDSFCCEIMEESP